MNGHDNVTTQLIDGIQLYSTMIATSYKQALINFVLKTRLSQSAILSLQPANKTKVTGVAGYHIGVFVSTQPSERKYAPYELVFG